MAASLHQSVLDELDACKGEWPSLAREIGMPYGTLKRIAGREVRPRIDTIEKLADYFTTHRRILARLRLDAYWWSSIAAVTEISEGDLRAFASGEVKFLNAERLATLAKFYSDAPLATDTKLTAAALAR